MDASVAIGSLSYLRDNLLRSSGAARKALDLAIAALEREHAERWRSVEEQRPAHGQRVLVDMGDGDLFRRTYDGGEWISDNGNVFKAYPSDKWRPMPEPAKEQEASRG